MARGTSRAPKPKTAMDGAPTQEAPTGEAPRDAFGRLIDQWGLPFNILSRVETLEALGLPDPNEDPDAWDGVEAPEALPLPGGAPLELVKAVEVPIAADFGALPPVVEGDGQLKTSVPGNEIHKDVNNG